MRLAAAFRSYSLSAMRSEGGTTFQRGWRLVLATGAFGYGVAYV